MNGYQATRQGIIVPKWLVEAKTALKEMQQKKKQVTEEVLNRETIRRNFLVAEKEGTWSR